MVPPLDPPPPPPAGSKAGPDGVPWAELEAHAAGELDPEQARRLEARLAQDADLRAAYARVERTEALLRGEALLPLPDGLTDRILAAVGSPRRVTPLAALARLAAAVLLGLGAWIAASGSAPTVASAAPPAEVRSVFAPVLEALPVPDLAEPLATLPLAAEGNGVAGLVAAAGAGVLLLVLGLALARAAGRRPPRASASATEINR